MRAKQFLLLFIVFFALSLTLSHSVYKSRTNFLSQAISPLVFLPTQIVSFSALEFKGILANFLMLNTLTFMGEKIEREEKLSDKEWQYVYRSLVQIINLDPMATDPFILAATTLPFDAGLVSETNELLEKVAIARVDDHRPYFFLYHNYYYFLKDHKTAAKYLKKAAKKPSAPSYYALLASRLNLYGGDIHASIVFTQEVLKETTDEHQKKYLLLRLDTLQRIAYLEKNIQKYKKSHGKPPGKLQDLVEEKLIPRIPTDPYGGSFYLLKNSRVYTTSKMVLQTKE